MIIKRELGDKGQVVIPKDIREFLDLKKNEKVIFEIKNQEVILKKEQDPKEFLEDFLNVPKLKRKITTKEIKKIIEEEYDKKISRL